MSQMSFKTKEQIISDYLGTIDFLKDDWSYKKIQEGLKKLIGEEPAISFNFKKDAIINEFNSESTEVTIVESVDIIYSPDLNEKFKRLSFKIGKIES
tara:strand:- start:5773 stop:6063 length:291 start_codon:yes stop_codon:yes gene_type:complete